MKFISNENALKYIKGLPPQKKTPISSLIKYKNPLAVDLLSKMLVLNP